MLNSVVVDKIALCDVIGIVECHLESFEGFFLSALGKDFLTLLYSEVLKNPSGFGVVAKCSGKVVGFAIGSIDMRGLYRRLIFRRVFRFFLYSLTALVKKPSIITRLFRALKIGKSSSDFSSNNSLMSIAVKKKFQAFGLGSLLLKAFLCEAKNHGAKDLFLTTDAESNDPVNQFYLKNGFSFKRTFFTAEGRKMNEYYYRF